MFRVVISREPIEKMFRFKLELFRGEQVVKVFTNQTRESGLNVLRKAGMKTKPSPGSYKGIWPLHFGRATQVYIDDPISWFWDR